MFAIDRRFFIEVGEFDDGMDGWGGENIDLPLRVGSDVACDMGLTVTRFQL